MTAHGCSGLQILTRLTLSNWQRKWNGLSGKAWSSQNIVSRSNVTNVKLGKMRRATTMEYVLTRVVIVMKIILASSVNLKDLVMSLDVSGTYCIFQSHPPCYFIHDSQSNLMISYNS